MGLLLLCLSHPRLEPFFCPRFPQRVFVFLFTSHHSSFTIPHSHSSTMEHYLAGLEQTLQQVLFSNDSNLIKEVPSITFLTFSPKGREL